jgi:hypothetical protein
MDSAAQRLEARGFVCSRNVPFEGDAFPLAARRSRFELTKFGFAENFFVFKEFPSLDQQTLRDYVSRAFRYALGAKALPLPRGLFESIFCFGVAIVPRIDPALAASVRNETPARHWSASEGPVVYETESGTLYYFEKTPFWGAAYYRGFRKLITEVLES